MPFVSEKQKRWMYANHPRMAARWQKHSIRNKRTAGRIDPTRSAVLRRSFVAELRRRFARLKGRIVQYLQFVVNDDEADRIAAFQKWLRAQYPSTVADEALWDEYVERGFRKGAARAFDDAKVPNKGDKGQFLQQAFRNPETVSKVKLLAGRAYDEMEGITDDMSLKITRVLTDGLVQGKGPSSMAKELSVVMDSSRARAEMLARTEIIRAHAEGQLDAFEDLGIEEVGAAVEWSTAGDDRVCDECDAMQGVVLKLDEASGMLPMHPNCRCAWVPAGVGEDSGGQKSSYKEVKAAIKEAGAEPGAPISRDRPTLNAVLDFERALNAFCPTGPGGGVDPSCGKDGGKQVPADKLFVKVLKSLPGSTHPQLVEDKNGDKWVMKSGPGPEQLKNEAQADALYRALGVAVPHSGISGGAKYSEYLEGGQTLKDYEASHSAAEVLAMRKEVGKGFVADALLANWDAIGLDKDNILIHNGKPVRIDNGGALLYRAQGSPKGAAFGPHVGELQSMRDPGKNPAAAAVFAHLTDADVKQQIKDVVGKKDAVLAAVTDPTTKHILSQRFDDLQKKLGEEPKPTLAPSGHAPGAKVLYKGEPATFLKYHDAGKGATIKTAAGETKKVSPNSLKAAGLPTHTTPLPKKLSEKEILDKHAAELEKQAVAPSKFMYGEKVLYKGQLATFKGYHDEGKGATIKVGWQSKKVSAKSLTKADGSAPAAAAASKSWDELMSAPRPELPKGLPVSGDDAKELARQHFKAVKSKLTADEIDRVRSYTGVGYSGLNEKMRKCPPKFQCLDDASREKFSLIESAIQKAGALPKPMKVVRGFPVYDSKKMDLLEAGLKKCASDGSDWTMPSVTSTSLSPNPPLGHGNSAKHVRYNIIAKSGLYVEPITSNPGEQEMIQSPRCKYRVHKVYRDPDAGGRLTADLEEVG